MPRRYSNALRWKVVHSYANKEGSQLSIAKRFSVSVSFVGELWNHYKRTGDVAPIAHGGGNPDKFTQVGYRFLERELEREPDLYLREPADRYTQKFGVSVSHTAINDALKHLSITQKKDTLFHRNRNQRGPDEINPVYHRYSKSKT